jgi:hypothetical protein
MRRNLAAGRLTTPKNGKTRRVDMSAQLTETLRGLLRARKKETLKKGWGSVPELVSCTETGGSLDADNFRHQVFYKLLVWPMGQVETVCSRACWPRATALGLSAALRMPMRVRRRRTQCLGRGHSSLTAWRPVATSLALLAAAPRRGDGLSEARMPSR